MDIKRKKTMKTIREYKKVLYDNDQNTLLGLHLATLINPLGKNYDELYKKDQSIHHLEEKIEVIVQMYNNGIDVFKDTYSLGSVNKAYYQIKLREYSNYK